MNNQLVAYIIRMILGNEGDTVVRHLPFGSGTFEFSLVKYSLNFLVEHCRCNCKTFSGTA